MYFANLSITNLDDSNSDDYEYAAFMYIQQLQAVQELKVDVKTHKSPGTRGDVANLLNIVIAGISSGAFIAVYTLAKDFIDLYKNAEVTLRFLDGSSITLNHLTQKEAEKLLNEHLEREAG